MISLVGICERWATRARCRRKFVTVDPARGKATIHSPSLLMLIRIPSHTTNLTRQFEARFEQFANSIESGCALNVNLRRVMGSRELPSHLSYHCTVSSRDHSNAFRLSLSLMLLTRSFRLFDWLCLLRSRVNSDRAIEAMRVSEGERGEAVVPESEGDSCGREQRATSRRACHSEFFRHGCRYDALHLHLRSPWY